MSMFLVILLMPQAHRVVGVIKNNYDSLELAPVGKLEQYIPYVELPIEMGFFRQVLRTATRDYMDKLQQ